MEVEKIFFEDKEIVLVGTAHVSRKSTELVRKIIEEENPDVVGIELDRQRYRALLNEKEWQHTNINKIIAEGKTYLFLANLLLASFQRKIGRELGTRPGMEMIEAVKAAREKKIPVALLDRDVTITMKRAMASMGVIEKAKVLAGLMMSMLSGQEKLGEKKIEELKQADTLNALLQELGKEMPKTKKVLVDERDVFIASRIMQQNAKKIVAVVGIGHLQGIKASLGKKTDAKGLLETPKNKSVFRFAKYAVPVAFIALIFLTFSSKGFQGSLNAAIAWILITGALSALGVLLARGHPFSAIAAFIASPITTLHPLLASGWIAGMVETKIRQPKVRDFEQLQGIEKLSDLQKNPVTRILLVVALANIGGTIGTIIAFSYIVAMV